MPRGGARAGSGPAKDPNSLRSMKLAEKNGKKVLPTTWTGDIPEWPLAYSSARTLEIWQLMWRKPQARIWAVQGSELELAIHVQTISEAEAPNAAGNLRTLVLQQMNSLLLTEQSLAKAGYSIAGADDDVIQKPSSSSTQASRTTSRTRLKAVPNVGSDG